MSEWLDLQQNKHDSLRLHEKVILDEQIARALEEDTLDRDDKKRLAKLGRICTELRRGKNVQNRQLQRWLTTDVYERFEQELLGQKEIRAELEAKPDELCEYEQLLKRAIFLTTGLRDIQHVVKLYLRKDLGIVLMCYLNEHLSI